VRNAHKYLLGYNQPGIGLIPTLNNCMSIFTNNSNIAPSPWSHRKCSKGNSHEIVDAAGKVLARIPVYQNVPNGFEHDATIAVISAAPELLAALREAAYHLDVAGVPLNPAFYELINRASITMRPIDGPRCNSTN
jgi:hypothetical protein